MTLRVSLRIGKDGFRFSVSVFSNLGQRQRPRLRLRGARRLGVRIYEPRADSMPCLNSQAVPGLGRVAEQVSR